MKILNFGSCNIDHVYSIDHIVTAGETETTHKLETFAGGKGLNQSIALARAGAEVYHAGCLGEDGVMLKNIMEESGVDISYIKTVHSPNGHAVIQVSAEGENAIFLYPGSNAMVSKEYIDSVLSNFNESDIILLQNEISNVEYIVDKAYEKGMCIILNPSPFDEKMRCLDFNKISYLILNEGEAKSIHHFETLDEGIQFFNREYPELKIMLTLGENGCVYIDKENEIMQPAFEVKAVDTTGAGDTFTGYFVAGLAESKEYKDIIKIASAASAIAVSRNGAAPSIPIQLEVIEALGKLEAKKSQKKNICVSK